MNKSQSFDNTVLYSAIANPKNNKSSEAIHAYLRVLTLSREINTTDEAILSKKYNYLSPHMIPKLIKNKYIKKVPTMTKTIEKKDKFDNVYDKRKISVKGGHVLTEGGKNAIEYQNRELYGYALSQLAKYTGKADIEGRQARQDLAATLVLCELCDINYTYNSHPHIAGELLFEHPEYNNNKGKKQLTDALRNCYSNKPIAYPLLCFNKTYENLDFIFGLQAKLIICDKEEMLPVYNFDYYSFNNPYSSLFAKNEKSSLKDFATTKTSNKSTPYKYPIRNNNYYIGRAIATISNMSNIKNIFDINKKNGFKIDEYLNKIPTTRQNIKNIFSMQFQNYYLLIRNYDFVKSQYKYIMLPLEAKEKINSLFFEKNEIATTSLYLKKYYEANDYRVIKKFKYGMNMYKVPLIRISPTTTFTKDGNPIYYLWDLDILRIHKAIMDDSEKPKIFCFFKDQIDIITEIINCYRKDKNTKMHINTRIIERSFADSIL